MAVFLASPRPERHPPDGITLTAGTSCTGEERPAGGGLGPGQGKWAMAI